MDAPAIKRILISSGVIVFLFFGIFRDFTPPIHRDILKAQSLLGVQRYEEAIAQYKKILKSNPPNPIKVKINYQLGELYSINLGKNEEAIAYFERIKKFYKDPVWLVKSMERIAEINFNFLRNYEASRTNYQKLVNFTPKLEKLDYYQYRMALSSLNLGALEVAAEEFKQIQSNSNHEYFVKSFYELGMVYFRKKDWVRAIGFWKEYLKRETRKDAIVQTKFMMANAYETNEQLKLAYDLYYSILGEYPNTEVLKNRLNSIYERRIARKR